MKQAWIDDKPYLTKDQIETKVIVDDLLEAELLHSFNDWNDAIEIVQKSIKKCREP